MFGWVGEKMGEVVVVELARQAAGGKSAKCARARLATLPKARRFALEEGAGFTLMGDGWGLDGAKG